MEDKDYVFKRDLLIPTAIKHTNDAVGPPPKREAELEGWRATWNRFYHQKMNLLAKEAGLT